MQNLRTPGDAMMRLDFDACMAWTLLAGVIALLLSNLLLCLAVLRAVGG